MYIIFSVWKGRGHLADIKSQRGYKNLAIFSEEKIRTKQKRIKFKTVINQKFLLIGCVLTFAGIISLKMIF